MAKPMRCLYPLRFRAKQTKLGHRNWRRVSLYPATPLTPLLPSDLQLIILNKIEFAPLDCCKIIKHGTGLLNRWAGFGTLLLRFSFVGFGNNFVLRHCQVCRGFVPSTFPPRCITPGCRIYNSIKLFASTFCARPAMANCNSFAIMRQSQSAFPDNGFTWGTLSGLAIGK